MGNEIEQELSELAADWAAAMVANDAERIGGVMADEWVMVSDRGIASKEYLLELIRSGELTHSRFEAVSDLRIMVYGESAVLTARVENTAHFRGQAFKADEWTTDHFVKRDGRWVCVLSQITAALNESRGE
ncbi:MAG: nuclear transport factor 2 family protein [Acidobacteria bacterium ACB1]|nr:nuclear transport factor 2 family protein [Acidobacteria bacterium ACB1]RIJ90916.1 MAG: DUF4440 domain-containing protein [Acidobacteriota bacterium]